MNRFDSLSLKNMPKFIGFILLCINVHTLQAQNPNCNFNDTNGYFYHWDFDADNLNFDFELSNSTSPEIKSKITNYEIQWGDGETISITNDGFPLSHTYSEGQYNLIIKLTYDGTVYDYPYIVYNTKPSVNTDILEGENGCEGQEFTFKLTGYENNPPNTVYEWNFGDGSTKIYWTLDQLMANDASISHTYNTSSCISENYGEHYDAGAVPIIEEGQLLIGIGKKAGPIIISKDISLDLTLWVNTSPETIESPHTGCANQTTFNFTNNSDYGLNNYLCRTSNTHEWTVYQLEGETKEPAILNTDYIYNYGSANTKGNISITFLNTGKYRVRFSLSNSCSHVLEQETGDIDIYENINTTTYAPQSFCLDDHPIVVFETTENEEIEAIQETEYNWSVNTGAYVFADGTNNNSQNPHFQFTQAGKFTVTLSKTSLCGTKDYQYTIDVSDKPEVAINLPSGLNNGGYCGDFTFEPTATFTDNGKETFGISNNEIEEYLWTFDNNGTISTSTLRNPSPITFTKVGNSSISLKARNSLCGWSDVHQIEFDIFAVPEPSFTRIDPSCEDEEITYNALPNAMQSYAWLFGNGNTASVQNATNSFQTAGSYTDRLTIVSTDGCENSISHEITILERAGVEAGDDANICTSDNTYSISGASVSNSASLEWQSEGDGSFSDTHILNPIYTLGTNDKTKTQIKLTLTTTGNAPCGEENDFMHIIITPKPSISISSPTATICENSSLDILGVSVANAESLQWTSDQGGTFSNSTVENPTYTPPANFSGQIHLSVKAIANGSCSDIEEEIELTVKALPIVEVGENTSICEDQTVELTGTSSSVTNLWTSLGDGHFTDASILTTQYVPGTNDIETGSVILQLEAEGDAPCTSVFDSKEINIIRNTKAEAGQDIAICKTESSYTIVVGDEEGQANANYYASIKWSSNGTGTFNNTTVLNTSYSPSENDLDNGSVELKLEANPLTPCSEVASDFMTLSFTDPPEVDAGDNITSCQNSIIDLNGTANHASSILWTSSGNGTFDDDTKLDAKYTPDPNETGIIILSLTAQPTGSCNAVSDNLKLTLIAKPVADAGIDSEICADESYNLNTENDGAKVYSAQSVLWQSLGDGSFDHPNSLNANYTPGSEDITNGSVVLQLTANPITPCTESHSDEMTLAITPLPIANAGDDKTICQGGMHEITIATASNYSSLEWKTSSANGYFENGETLTPTYHPGPDEMGATTLSLIVHGEGSCSFVQDDMILNMTPAPVVSLRDNADICEDGIYLATGTEVQHTPDYNWSTTGQGTITNEDSLKPTYTAKKGETGDISLCLTIQGNGLCAEKTACTNITIVPHPSVNAGNDGEVCANQVYQMNVGDQLNQVNANSWSSIEYTTEGDGFFQDQDGLNANYILGENDKFIGQVKLKIKAYSINPCDESAEDDMLLNITPEPEVEAGTDAEICQGDSYTLLNAHEQYTSDLIWKTNDGGSFSDENILKPTYTPANGKTGIVQLELIGKGQGSCASTSDILSLNIIPIPHVSAGDDASICFGKSYDLISTEATSFSTVLWTSSGTGEFVDASKLKATYVPSEEDYMSGSVLLRIRVEGLEPCTLNAEDEMLLNFAPTPTVNAGEDAQICQETGSYTIKQKSEDNPMGSHADNYSSIIWETSGNGSIQNSNTLAPTYIASPDETGIVRLILKANGNANCDQVEDEMQLNIVPTPIANFTTEESCVENPIQFKDLSTAENYSVESWLWTFEGGTTSNLQNPEHQFYEVKNYKVSLSITNSEGCTELTEKMISVNPLPEIEFTHESIAAINTPVEFKNNSLNTVTYHWDFGDGKASMDFDPKHAFTNKGFFTIRLWAESMDGCSNKLTSEIEIIGKPEANFTKTGNGCGPLSVEFTNTSTGKFVNYLWDFGNGTQSTQANPPPVVYEQGVLSDTTYFVSLTIENKAGISVSSDKVIVKPIPTALFEILPASYGCSPVLREIFNQSKGLATNYEFDFGDGSTYAYKAKNIERPFEHSYTTGDIKSIYPISLVATNECGSSTITKNMTVYPNAAVAVMKVDEAEGCAPFTVAFQNLSTGAGDYLESDWVFEDGEAAIREYKGETVYHTFEKEGIYQVQLSVHDTCASDITTRQIIVHDANTIDFEMEARKYCMFEEIQLNIPEEVIDQFTNFTWNLGDGTHMEGSNIIHSYDKAGSYLIKLSAISKENGCKKTQNKELVIHQKPIADYSLSSNEGCETFQVSFNNKSSYADYYQWDFNDSSKSSAENPTHQFSQGNYTVSLIAESIDGCLDTLNAEIISRPKPVAQFEMDSNRSCMIPTTLKIDNTSPDNGFNSYVWDFDNGAIRTNKQPIEETFDSEGKYNIQLIAKNQFHCTDTFTRELNVYTPPVAKYKIASQTTCQDELIEFTDISTNNHYCYWAFSDGTTAEGKNVSHIFKDYGRYDLSLKVIGDGNCADSLFAKDSIFVYPKPNVDFDWENVNTPPEGIEFSKGVKPPNNGLIQFKNETEIVHADWMKDNNYTYKWEFDDLKTSEEKDPLHKYKNNGEFKVKLNARSTYTCENSITIPVAVNLMSALYVPNAFNPGNPNPQVALFLPKGIGIHTYTIEILDHWGKVIWFSNQLKDGRPAEGWDGSFKGKPLPQGVYIWKIRAVFQNGETWEGVKVDGKYHREGSVTLLK